MKKTFIYAAFHILKNNKSGLTPKEIVDRAINLKLIVTESKRPEATLSVKLHNDPRFMKLRRGLWVLR